MVSPCNTTPSSQAILVTGAAGFIGMHVAKRLQEDGHRVIGIDNFCPSYSSLGTEVAGAEDSLQKLKRARQAELRRIGITVLEQPVEDTPLLKKLIDEHKITHIVHLAALGAVRESKDHPTEFIRSNISGFLSVLEAVRQINPSIVTVYASSSSVYGEGATIPFTEGDLGGSPMSLYGITKKDNEDLAHLYHRQYKMPLMGLRFFTVYGPWGRPDMSYSLFADKMAKGETIKLFEKDGVVASRDFTYVDDIVDGIVAAVFRANADDIVNLGNNRPESVEHLVECLEESLGYTAKRERAPLPETDPLETGADIQRAKQLLGFSPKTSLKEGIAKFAQWYKGYHS